MIGTSRYIASGIERLGGNRSGKLRTEERCIAGKASVKDGYLDPGTILPRALPVVDEADALAGD